MKELFTAISQLQGDVLNATKDKQGYNYSYADLAQILEIARPLLKKYGLSVIQFPKTQNEAMIGMRTILAHKSGESIEDYFEMPIPQAQKMSTAQACGSVITYMRRYSLAAVLGIAQTDDDADTQLLTRVNKSVDEDAIKEAVKSIREAKTMDELQEIFMNLDAKVRTKVNHEKDKKKQELGSA